MKIKLVNAGKRFNREWIFRNAEIEFNTGAAYAITGPNGSGKSTLLQTIAGIAEVSEGHIIYSEGEHTIQAERFYRRVSFSAPYLDVIEEMTITEFLNFQRRFKPFIQGISTAFIIEAIGLDKSLNKQIRFYSSGMKQRVKLAQAIFSNTGVLLLDEPCTNLDAKGIELYYTLMETYGKNRLVIISSNDKNEYPFCTEILSMQSYKNNAIA